MGERVKVIGGTLTRSYIETYILQSIYVCNYCKDGQILYDNTLPRCDRCDIVLCGTCARWCNVCDLRICPNCCDKQTERITCRGFHNE